LTKNPGKIERFGGNPKRVIRLLLGKGVFLKKRPFCSLKTIVLIFYEASDFAGGTPHWQKKCLIQVLTKIG